MKTIDDTVLREWVDLELEGELGGTEKALLEERLPTRTDLARERRALSSLHAVLADARIPVREGFRARVMASLPAAAWARQLGRRSSAAWALPAAMVVVLGLGAALVLGAGGAGGGQISDHHAWGVGAALFDFLQATVLAGAGLLFATWRGVGMGLEELIAESGASFAALAVFVLFLDLLFVLMLRRKPAPVAADSSSSDEPTAGG